MRKRKVQQIVKKLERRIARTGRVKATVPAGVAAELVREGRARQRLVGYRAELRAR